jgi:hypothetical protein
MKSTNCTGSHQFHPPCYQLCSSTSLLVDDKFQLQEDLNSAPAKLGTAANLHYVCSACKGTPTVQSRSQIAYLCKKKSSFLNGKEGKSEDGGTDDIYTILEASGNYYVSLLAHGPSVESTSTIYPTCQAILFNESRIGNITGQEDVLLSVPDDHDMLQIVNITAKSWKLLTKRK